MTSSLEDLARKAAEDPWPHFKWSVRYIHMSDGSCNLEQWRDFVNAANPTAILALCAQLRQALAVVDAFADYERLFDENSVAAMLRYNDAVKALEALKSTGEK